MHPLAAAARASLLAGTTAVSNRHERDFVPAPHRGLHASAVNCNYLIGVSATARRFSARFGYQSGLG
jgi:hypothetical protein